MNIEIKIKRDKLGRFRKGSTGYWLGTKGIKLSNSGSFQIGAGKKPFNENVIYQFIRNGKMTNYIKVKNKWQEYSRHIWESVYGKIPKGIVLIHLDDNKLNDDIDNLKAIRRGDLFRIN